MNNILEPILITGAARSGTSMTAGIVDICGGFGGKLSGPNRWNKKGMFENTEIRNSVVKPFIREKGWDPLCQKPLPDINVLKNLTDEEVTLFLNNVTGVIKRNGYKAGRWYYKGAKMIVMYPLWVRAFPDAKWIFVRRDPNDIADSCMRTPFMRGYKKKKGWLKWVDAHEKCLEEIKETPGIIYREIWPQKLVDGNDEEYSNFEECINSYGLEWDGDKARKFVSPQLWKV